MNILTRTIIFLITLVFLTSAHANQAINEQLTAGQKNFESLCLACHNATATKNDRIAPPMVAITEHYISDETSLDEFIQQVTDYVNDPTEEKSKMPGAVRKFGLMPKMGYSSEQLNSVATYLFHNHTTLERPVGFKAHRKQQQNKKQQQRLKDEQQETNPKHQSYLEMGQQFAMSTQAVLGKNLMAALNEQGTEAALTFCNEHAIELTAGAVKQSQVKIKRVSDRNRNPLNKANEQELNYIATIQEKLKQQQPISGQVIQQSDSVVGYFPITTNPMCLQCHGEPNQDIASNTLDKIQSLYPNDLAINYGVNELRGIWVIEMPLDQPLESP